MSLIKKYPFLVDNDLYSYLYKNDTWVDCLPPGWQPRFLELCETIYQLIKQYGGDIEKFKMLQVKEKYGAARIYWSFETRNDELHEELTKAIDTMSYESEIMCVVCAAFATHDSKGWVNPYCEKCAIEWLKNYNADYDPPGLTFADTFTKREEQ